MSEAKSYFFCGIGGSGMLPLASILRARGHRVTGSDRALDQGRTADKFAFLDSRGIDLHPQDGSGIVDSAQILVTSAAVEESVPDVIAARAIGAAMVKRPELLAELVNGAETSIAVGGTSGKSTVTGMIGWILHAIGRDPTVMNGAVMKNFADADAPFASAVVGGGAVFVSEVDESDGSIALYDPTVAVLGNVTLDHKSLDELRGLFADFVGRARIAVVNLDDPEARAIGAALDPARRRTVAFGGAADLVGGKIAEEPLAISFEVTESDGATVPVRLAAPGRHNAANALLALGAVRALGIELEPAAAALAGFKGLRRRFEVVGSANGVTVIDDFAHNPDKIAATMATLHAFPGRVLVLFQPHGYGPLKVMGDALIDCFADALAPEDVLILPDPAYYGGTVDRAVGSGDIVAGVAAAGREARHIADRAEAARAIAEMARPGDRIIVMGARDDSLSQLAADILAIVAVPLADRL